MATERSSLLALLLINAVGSRKGSRKKWPGLTCKPRRLTPPQISGINWGRSLIKAGFLEARALQPRKTSLKSRRWPFGTYLDY
jgi:hypothetical protein